MIEETACEGTTLELKCERGQEIMVVDANYGRTSRRVCNGRGEEVNRVRDCKSPRSREIVNAACGERRRCSIKADNSVFGNPCPGVRKYLEVSYICRRRADRTDRD